MTQDNLEKIKQITQGLFKKMDLGIEVEVKKPQDQTLPIDLKMEKTGHFF